MSDGHEETPRGQTALERIVLHAVQAVTVAGIIGGYLAVSDLRTSNAVLQVEVKGLSDRLEDFRDLVDDRYTARQAQRDFKPLIERVADHEARLRTIEKGTRRNP